MFDSTRLWIILIERSSPKSSLRLSKPPSIPIMELGSFQCTEDNKEAYNNLNNNTIINKITIKGIKMNSRKSTHLQGKTEKILKGMLDMLRKNDDGVSLDDFIDYLQKHKTSGNDTKKWNPKGRGKERAVYRYIEQLGALGCKIAYNVDNGRYMLISKDWRFPENTPWSLAASSFQKVGEKLLPMLKGIILPQDILERIDKGLHICIKDKDMDAEKKTIQKTVSAWAERKVLMIKYGRGSTPKELTIEPHGLVFHNSEWQIAAMERGKAKTFSLSKIVEAYLSEKHFDFRPEVLTEALRENGKDKTEEKQEDK